MPAGLGLCLCLLLPTMHRAALSCLFLKFSLNTPVRKSRLASHYALKKRAVFSQCVHGCSVLLNLFCV